jgi:hypothetical protein
MTATTSRTFVHRQPAISPLASALAFLTVCLAVVLGAAAPAAASVSASVRNACMSDYFAYCAGLEVGSVELRRCMSRAGPKLSQACVSALVGAGEVSRAEVDRRKAGASRTTRTAAAPARSRSATRAASRSACIQGPARPGARSSTICRNVAGAAGNRRGKRLATLR